MLSVPLWLLTHHDDPDARFLTTIHTGTGLHESTIRQIRTVLEDADLVRVESAPAGRGSRTTHTLTPAGRRFASTIRDIDTELRTDAGLPPPLAGAPLDPAAHPVLEFERAYAWRLLHDLDEHPNPDERFLRILQHRLGIAANLLLDLRDRLLALGVVEQEGVLHGGRGARLVLSPTALGGRVIALARRFPGSL